MIGHGASTVQRLAMTLAVVLLVSACVFGQDNVANLSLRATSSNLLLSPDEPEEADATTITTTETASASTHPQWVLDIESAAWPGFMTGMDGFDDFVAPIGMPMYFEDPFIRSDLRLLYIYHTIPGGSVLRGGQVHVVAAQIRVALTDRLALIATKDGYSWVDSHITAGGDGWNDLAAGLKYAIYANPAEQFIFSGGIRWELSNGSGDVLQGNSQELSPFLTFAKGWDKLHFLGAVSGRFPTNRHAANYSLVWNLHLDYELTETFRPVVEFHGIHWLSNAGRVPISEDYLDVGSIGASEARGRDFFSCGIGFRWQALDNINIGLSCEVPLESADAHLQDYRVTLNTVISF